MAVTDIKDGDTEAQKKAKRTLNLSKAKKNKKDVRAGVQTETQKKIVSVGKEVLPFLVPIGLLAGAAVKLGRVAFQSKYGKKAWNAVTKGVKNFDKKMREPEFRRDVMKRDRWMDPASGRILSNKEGLKRISDNRAVKGTLKTVQQVAGGVAIDESISKADSLLSNNKPTQSRDIGDGSRTKVSKAKDKVIDKSAATKPMEKVIDKSAATKPTEKPTQSKDMSEGYSKKKDKPKKVLDKEAMSATTKDGPSSSKSRSGEPVPKRNAKPSDIDKSAGKSKKVISKKAKNREDDFSQGVRQSTKDSLIFDTTDEAFQSEADDLNLRKGGMPKRKAFGKGGMYKPSKKTYGMKKGGFTSRGASY
jgi:hypothetical protein